MSSESPKRAAYFDGRYPPDPTTFAGTLMTRVATAIDTREALVEAFSVVAADMPTYFPDEKPLSPDQVETLVDSVIADHNDRVRHASPDAIRLLDALDGFPANGLAISFGAGSDADSAMAALLRTAGHAIELGATVRGYVYATADDAAGLILNGLLPLTYGIFAETGMDLAEAAERVRTVLEQQGLPILEHDAAAQRVLVGPIVYAVPYHGHRLHERAQQPD